MPEYEEENISEAIDALLQSMSVKIAARLWNIPKTTLIKRVKGIKLGAEIREATRDSLQT